tara:strand:+ start:2482 stop:2781 length:300 start_codon:yes stop_codon:yes gene_type:complete
MTYKILTANRLQDGLVIYLGADGWSADIDSARKAFDDDQAAALDDLGRQAAARNEVADPYLIDLEDDGPVRWREVIRANGPTVRRDLGYQADRHAGGGH